MQVFDNKIFKHSDKNNCVLFNYGKSTSRNSLTAFI